MNIIENNSYDYVIIRDTVDLKRIKLFSGPLLVR